MKTAHLKLSLLGVYEAVLDGKPITRFKSDKVRALIAYLAVEADYPHRRQKLVGMFWGEYQVNSARANLRNTLSLLREVISDADVQPPFREDVNGQTSYK